MSRRASKPDTQADISIRECLENRQSFLMIAGAGSGKTTSLIKALAYLREHHGKMLKRNGQCIACITYTNVAVDEIWTDVDKDTLFHVSTIHSFLWEIAKPFQREIRTWVEEQIQTQIYELEEKNTKSSTRAATISKNKKIIDQYKNSYAKLNNILSFKYESDRRYTEGILGHSDIIKMVPQLLTENPLLRKIIARKYPFIFVDESQDTDKAFIEALKMIDQDEEKHFCLGFFGDPMQQIYATGIGAISGEKNWKTITKEENFRSSKAVRDLINRIRKDGDGLEQTDGLATLSTSKKTISGSARLFIMPSDQDRKECLARTRQWLASQKEPDPLWIADTPEADLKILVILHRMAADQLGFLDLFLALHDKGPDSFKIGFKDGTLWVIKPFLQTLIPLAEAAFQGNKHQIISLLREAKSPLLTQDRLIKESNPSQHLLSIKTHVTALSDMLYKKTTTETTVKEFLERVFTAQLVPLDDRMNNIINDNMIIDVINNGKEVDESESEKKLKAIEAFLNCPISQLLYYRNYINGESPFSTQHNVKGAEFSRVLVVLNDEEAQYNLYSYDRLLGLANLSDTDLKNKKEGKENSIDRTRRLFYVCCSRAINDLAIILFTQHVGTAREKLISAKIFNEDNIFTAENLLPT